MCRKLKASLAVTEISGPHSPIALKKIFLLKPHLRSFPKEFISTSDATKYEARSLFTLCSSASVLCLHTALQSCARLLTYAK